MPDLFSFENFDSLSGEDYTVIGTQMLSNAMSNIASYQAAKKNLKTAKKNAERTFAATEYNISVERANQEQEAAQRSAQYAVSGFASADFADIERSIKAGFEKGVSAMREEVREAMFDDIRRAIKDKKNAKVAAARGTALSVTAGVLGMYTGNPMAAMAFSNAGNSIGRAWR